LFPAPHRGTRRTYICSSSSRIGPRSRRPGSRALTVGRLRENRSPPEECFVIPKTGTTDASKSHSRARAHCPSSDTPSAAASPPPYIPTPLGLAIAIATPNRMSKQLSTKESRSSRPLSRSAQLDRNDCSPIVIRSWRTSPVPGAAPKRLWSPPPHRRGTRIPVAPIRPNLPFLVRAESSPGVGAAAPPLPSRRACFSSTYDRA